MRCFRRFLIVLAAVVATLAVPAAPVAVGASVRPVPAGPGAYSLLTSTGRLIGYGGAYSGTATIPSAPVSAVVASPTGHGAYAAATDGSVATMGDATFLGSMAGTRLARPVVGMAATPDGRGYWLVASDGGIFAFGDAGFFGSTGALHLARPVVGMAAAPDGRGYWLVASDGGIFAFGAAAFLGSTGAISLAKPVIAMSRTATGAGYWLVASDGGVFSFGDAPFLGSAAGQGVAVVGMAASAPGGNYGDPFRAVANLVPMRVDEGVDFGGSGPVDALGDGVVTSTTGNWPGGAFISYQLTDGPAAGKSVYVAENLTPTVTVGQMVTPGTVVGIAHDGWPYMETGWAADGYGDTMAAQAGQWTAADDAASLPSAFGVNFNQLLTSLGGTPGLLLHPTVVGALPGNWPTW